MKVTELIDSARFVVDADGRKRAVLLDYDRWQELLETLEDMADLRVIDHALKSGEEAIPWERAKEDLRAQGVKIT